MPIQAFLPRRAIAEQLLPLFPENIHVETVCRRTVIKLLADIELWQLELMATFVADDDDFEDNIGNELDSAA